MLYESRLKHYRDLRGADYLPNTRYLVYTTSHLLLFSMKCRCGVLAGAIPSALQGLHLLDPPQVVHGGAHKNRHHKCCSFCHPTFDLLSFRARPDPVFRSICATGAAQFIWWCWRHRYLPTVDSWPGNLRRQCSGSSHNQCVSCWGPHN